MRKDDSNRLSRRGWEYNVDEDKIQIFSQESGKRLCGLIKSYTLPLVGVIYQKKSEREGAFDINLVSAIELEDARDEGIKHTVSFFVLGTDVLVALQDWKVSIYILHFVGPQHCRPRNAEGALIPLPID